MCFLGPLKVNGTLKVNLICCIAGGIKKIGTFENRGNNFKVHVIDYLLQQCQKW